MTAPGQHCGPAEETEPLLLGEAGVAQLLLDGLQLHRDQPADGVVTAEQGGWRQRQTAGAVRGLRELHGEGS